MRYKETTDPNARWNQKRLILVNNLGIQVNQLYTVGIDELFIDGSFVEDKASPIRH